MLTSFVSILQVFHFTFPLGKLIEMQLAELEKSSSCHIQDS